MKLLSWNTTLKCNLYCDHCYRDSSLDTDTYGELSTNEAKTLIEDVKKAGFRMIILSGGEPLLRDDIFDLARYGTDLGLIMSLGTNGTLIDEDMARKIKDSGIRSCAVSIDSSKAEVHDKFRGLEGAWQKTIDGIKILINEGLRVQVNLTISRINKDEISDVIKLAEDLGASSFHSLFLVETGRGENMSEDYLSKEEYEKAIEEVLGYQSQMYIRPVCAPQAMVKSKEMGMEDRFTKGCIAGLRYCSVLADGQVHICPYAEVKAGDIRQEPFDQIWEESQVFKALREFSAKDSSCGSCRHNDSCGGCRARAYSKTGDFLGFDDYCLL